VRAEKHVEQAMDGQQTSRCLLSETKGESETYLGGCRSFDTAVTSLAIESRSGNGYSGNTGGRV